MKKQVAMSISLVLILILSLSVSGCAQKQAVGSWQEQYDLGIKYLSEGNYEEAIIAFQNVIEIDKRNTRAYAGLVLAYAYNGQYDEAFGTVDDALAMDLDNQELLYESMIAIYLQQGDEAGAKACISAINDQIVSDYLKNKFPNLFEETLRRFENQIVNFVDPNFEKAIRVMLNKPDGDIWSDELAEVYVIRIMGIMVDRIGEKFESEESIAYDITNYGFSNWKDENNNRVPYGGIKRLDDLVWFPNLKQLSVDLNQITNIDVVAGLENLGHINLEGNKISDISVLKDMINLGLLGLSDNQISDINVLAGLTNLEELSLEHNQISDISALDNLRNLRVLLLSNNKISDISAIKDLKNLTFLSLGANQISDISSLKALTQLETLHIYENPITDWSPIEHLSDDIVQR